MMPFVPFSPRIALVLEPRKLDLRRRMLRLAAGGTRAYNEMARMSIEKAEAFAEAQIAAAAAAMAGRSNAAIANRPSLRQKRVYPNKRRLLRR